MLQASSVAGSEARRRRRRAGGGGVRAAVPAAAEDAAAHAQPGDPASGVTTAHSLAGVTDAVQAPRAPPAIPSPSAPARSHGRPGAASSSRVSALVEETDVVGEVVSTSQSGIRVLSGALESGDSVLKRTVFKEMPLDGSFLLSCHRTETQCPIAGVFKQLSESEAVQRPAVQFDDVPAHCTPGKRAPPRSNVFTAFHYAVFTAFPYAFFTAFPYALFV